MFLLFFVLLGGVFFLPAWLVYRRFQSLKLLKTCGFPIVPSKSLFLGNLSESLDAQTPFTFSKWRQKLGPTFGIMHGAQPTIVTSDVELIHQICSKNFSYFHSRMVEPFAADPDNSDTVHMFGARGARWKRLRSTASLAVSNANLKKLFPSIVSSADWFLEDLSCTLNTSIPLHSSFQRLTSDVIGRCAFGVKDRLRNSHYLTLFQKAFGCTPNKNWTNSLNLQWILPEIGPLWKWTMKQMQVLRTEKSPLEMYDDLIAKLSKERSPDEGKSDFLQFFKNVEDPAWNLWITKNDQRTKMAEIKIVKKMTEGETRAQSRFISIAGFDTTANSLTYLCHLLALHPECLDRVAEEVDALPDPITYESLQNMTYLHAAICETLRLYPHASPLQSRLCIEDCQIGSHHFPKGVALMFDTWSAHKNPDYWGEDVLSFRPERFLGDEAKRNAKFWMAFGVGPRQCIGMRFAILEEKVVMAKLLKRLRIIQVEPKEPLLTFRDTGTIWPERINGTFVKRVDL
ncbi:hypothetical protein L596_016681 [Steinernema carpocapsae]|uniref:Cytochrome P450 n=1 Tax=Steinernema carpocapsae TaxID=34508 RepID=A0A4U5NJG7_STECR|nr:hypothetical protein L596_016681 [Steinernema carpocapsae]